MMRQVYFNQFTGMKMMRLSSLAAALILAGCASAPPSKVGDMPVDYPSAWTADAVPEETLENISPEEYGGGWLLDFDDPVLMDMVYRAQVRNYDLQAAVARLGVAEAEAFIAGADLYPQLSAGFDGSRQKNNFSAQGFSGIQSSTFNNYGLNANVSWELDVWGRVRDGESAAIGDAQAAAADLYGARQSLAANTASLWFNTIEARMQLELAENTWDSFDKTTRSIQRRFESGVSPALDLRLSKAQTASALAAVELRKNNLDSAKRDLEVLLGDYPAGTLEAASDLPSLNQPVPVGLPSELLERRPDLVAAERRLASTDKRISEARKAFLPAISLTGSYGTTSTQLENLLDNSFSIWSIAGNLLQPIFQGGRLTGALQRAKASAQEALANYGQSALDAFNEVEKALASERFLDSRLEALRVASIENAAAEEAAWQRYERGLTDIITVLESQRRAFESHSAYIEARNLRLINRVNLYLALGGDFGPTPDVVVATVNTPFSSEQFPSPESVKEAAEE